MTSSLSPPACAHTASPGVSPVSARAPSHWELAQGAALSGGRSALWICEFPGTPGAEGSRLSRYCPSMKATGPEFIQPHLELPTVAGHALSYWAWEPTGVLLPGVPSTASPSRAADRPLALGPGSFWGSWKQIYRNKMGYLHLNPAISPRTSLQLLDLESQASWE